MSTQIVSNTHATKAKKNRLQFQCPLCASRLQPGEKVWQCQVANPEQRQHSFDVAKQGYVNLLPVQHKKSKHPGDSEHAILARQRFLSAGFYQVLAEALTDFAQCFSGDLANKNWLDIGCGEGYNTEQFLQLQPNTLTALDISKPAVMATAKRLKALNRFDKRCHYTMVASASQVPIADQSLQVISTIFSPILPDEFARLLDDNGQVIIAKPAPNHLVEMRQGLFEQVIEHDSDKFIEAMATHFVLAKEQQVTQQIAVNEEVLVDLLNMTPYTFRAKPERRQALIEQCQKQGKMALTLNFVIYGFNKIV